MKDLINWCHNTIATLLAHMVSCPLNGEDRINALMDVIKKEPKKHWKIFPLMFWTMLPTIIFVSIFFALIEAIIKYFISLF